jgi:hypothetical protein
MVCGDSNPAQACDASPEMPLSGKLLPAAFALQ